MRRFFLAPLALLGCASTVAPNTSAVDASVARDAVTADVPPPADRPSVTDAPALDAGRVISDDCARGTWCWERPIPSGERAVGARVFAADRAVYVTRGGTVARWDGQRWRTARLALPAAVTSAWIADTHELYLTCTTDDVPGMTRQRWLVRVRGETPEVLAGPQTGSASALVGSGPDDLWAVDARALVHWNGAAWTALPAPGDVVLSGVTSVAPGEVIALESWGSGSGYGILHRVRAGAWERLAEFRPLRVRVDGPIVPVEGALWLRAWDTAQSRAELARVDPATGAAELVTPPTDESGVTLHNVGGRLWATYGARAWERVMDRWVVVPNVPGGYAPILTGSAPSDAWVFGDVVARREGEAWNAWGDALTGVAGFWRDTDPLPALVTVRPGALAMQDPMDRARWPLRRFVSGEGLQGWAPAGSDGGWMADTVGLVRVRNRFDAGRVDWPEGIRREGPFGGWDDALWVVSARGIERYRERRWLGAVAIPPIAEAPGQTPQVMTVHGVSSDTAVVATTLVTGDKQVYVRVHALRGGAFTELTALRGVFGSSTEVHVAGSLPAVWIAFDGLHRWDGERLTRVDPEVTPLDVHALPDGRAVGVDDARVYAWSADGRRAQTLAVPRAHEMRFQYVRAGADGTLRVAANGGQVLRFTP